MNHLPAVLFEQTEEPEARPRSVKSSFSKHSSESAHRLKGRTQLDALVVGKGKVGFLEEGVLELALEG